MNILKYLEAAGTNASHAHSNLVIKANALLNTTDENGHLLFSIVNIKPLPEVVGWARAYIIYEGM